MARSRSPLFLERAGYRRRRLLDAVRLVVLLGICLWMLPVLWPVPDAEQTASVAMSGALFYIFGVWAVLIALSFALSSRLRRLTPPDAAT